MGVLMADFPTVHTSHVKVQQLLRPNPNCTKKLDVCVRVCASNFPVYTDVFPQSAVWLTRAL